MEKNDVEVTKKEPAVIEKKLITRKQAIKRTGLIAVSAATMMILLQSPKAQACSNAPTQNNDDHHHKDGGRGKNDGHDSPWGNRKH